MPPSIAHNEEKAELDQVLSSAIFAKSPTSAKLLQFICKKYFGDEAGDLKEYSIGVEALGLPVDFDPAMSSIVRVELDRLREKLEEYYEGEGADHPVKISLEAGSYVPHFLRGDRFAPGSRPAPDSAHAVSRGEAVREFPSPDSFAEARAEAIRKFWKSLAFSGSVLLAIVVFAIWGFRRAETSAAGTVTPASQPHARASAIVPGNEVRILAGHTEERYIDRAGRAWNPDNYYSGGQPARRNGVVAGAEDPELFASERFGKFDYSIPVAPGKYAVTLYFSETHFGTANTGSGGAGNHVFDVHCNGVPLLKDFDIFKEAGGASRALSRTFHGLEPNAAGQLVISFIPVKNYACVNAFEVVNESE